MSDESDSTADGPSTDAGRPADEPSTDETEASATDQAGGETADESESSLSATPSLIDRVAEHDDGLASDVETLYDEAKDREDRISDLEAELERKESELDDLQSRLKRKQADFQNYKKRRKRKESEIRERATEDLVERLVGVRDNLRRALDDDHEDVEGLREGVKMTLSEFDRVLDAEGVSEIAPEPGTDVDPQRHEVMMRVESESPEDTIADVYEPGYEMAGKVIRAAKVTVSDGD